MSRLRLYLTFYRSFALFSLLVTLLFLTITYRWGAIAFTAVFWFKLATLSVAYYHLTTARRERFIYYKNLGLTRTELWGVTLTADFSLFLALTFTSLNLR